tara:strand:+ start:118 stop:510 length:393 start_codon:yes stop_codon:yes gene_type:complete
MKTIFPASYEAKLDLAGMGLSVACAIHCLATSVLLSALPVLGFEFLGHEGFELGMITAILLPAGFTFINGFWIHGKKGHFLLGVIGLAIFLLVRPFVDHSLEPYATLLGGTAFVWDHLINWKWSKPCEDC